MTCRINDLPVLECEITENRVAAWVATVEADTDEAITGSVELDIEGETFVGTVFQGAIDSERWKGLVVGGKGGLNSILGARSYTLPGAKTVLDDVMRESGETLDAEAQAFLAAKRLPFWTRLMGAAHEQIRQVADELGVDWRITRAGDVWLGEETWLPVEADYIEIDQLPEHRAMIIAYREADNDRPVIRPGTTLEGRRVQRVQTRVNGDGLRQVLFFDEEKGEAGLVATIMRRVRELLLPKIHMRTIYGAKVVSQIADGTLDLQPDDELVAGRFKSIGKVPPVFGVPGITIQASPGAKVRFFWDAGRPSRPRAGLWDQGAPVLVINVQATNELNLSAATTTVTGTTRAVVESNDTRLGSADATDKVALESKVHGAISAMLSAGIGVAGTQAFAAAKVAWDAATLGGELPEGAPAPPAGLVPVGATKVAAE